MIDQAELLEQRRFVSTGWSCDSSQFVDDVVPFASGL